jgi:hypothetical protein
MKAKLVVFASVLVARTLYGSAVVGREGKERRPQRERWNQMTLTAKVVAVDMETRELTLKGIDGHLVTVVAGSEVERLSEISPGDMIVTEFWTYIKAEFRDPTAEEMAEPVVVVAEAGKTPGGAPPAAAIGAVVRAVVTVEAISRPDMLYVLRGPNGRYVTIEAEDPVLMTKINVGEALILTYGEALVMSLEKVAN